MTKNIFRFILLVLISSSFFHSCKNKTSNTDYDRYEDVQRYLKDVIKEYPLKKDFYLIFLENSYCNACIENDFSEFMNTSNKSLPIILIASKDELYFNNLAKTNLKIRIYNDTLAIYEKYGLINPKTLYFFVDKDFNIKKIK